MTNEKPSDKITKNIGEDYYGNKSNDGYDGAHVLHVLCLSYFHEVSVVIVAAFILGSFVAPEFFICDV